jgi:histone H3/H4
METNHDIFVEGEFVEKDGRKTVKQICIQDAIKSMSYER